MDNVHLMEVALWRVRSTLFYRQILTSSIGDIIGLRVLGNNILVLNDLKTINDLLDKRGATYSHRPVFTVVGELMELDKVPLDAYSVTLRRLTSFEGYATHAVWS